MRGAVGRTLPLFVIVAITVLAYAFVERAYFAEHVSIALGEADAAQALAFSELARRGPISLRPDGLHAGETRLDGSTEIVDAVKSETGFGCTIFLGNRRIATTAVAQGGTGRALGTTANDEVTEDVLREGRIFRGVTTTIGKEWVIVYRPLRDRGGALVGMVATYHELAEMMGELRSNRLLLGSTFSFLLVVTAFLFVRVERGRRRQEQAEAEAREREKRLRAVFDGTADGILTIHEDGRVESLNAAAERVLGSTAAEAVGRPISTFFAEAEGRELEARIAAHPRDARLPAVDVRPELTGRRKDGPTFPIEVAIAEVRLPDRRLFTAIVRDISERKAVERMKNEFVSTVSHELRTPLTSIRGALGLLEGGIVGDLPAEAKDLVTIARSNSDRLIRLVNDILDLEKIEAGKLELRREDLEADDLVAAAFEGVAGTARGAEVRVEREGPAGCWVRGDRDRLVQVLVNLLSNAVKFSPRGAAVTARLERRAGRLRFSVVDRGRGVPKEMVPKLFAKFQQLDASDAREKGGTGLGLAISKAIVEQHGGEIGVESEPGKGSTFWLELASPEPARVEAAPAPAEDDARPLILVVEDDPELSRVLSRLLASEGYGFQVARVLNLSPHYAKTTFAWYERLIAKEGAMIDAMGEPTYRAWRVFLAGSTASFLNRNIHVYRILCEATDPDRPSARTSDPRSNVAAGLPI